jgi:hypothetical protein
LPGKIRKRKPRSVQIKIWPEITNYLPAVIPFERLRASKNNPFDFDFSGTSAVEAASLNLLLIKLIKHTSSLKNIDWEIKLSSFNSVNYKLNEIGLFDIFPKVIPNNNLFWQKEFVDNEFSKIKTTEAINSKLLPIYHIEFSKHDDRRKAVEDFEDWLEINLMNLSIGYGIKLNKLILILVEMAKNSADHTLEDAFFGIDIIEIADEVMVQFSFGDLGLGINRTIRPILATMDRFKGKEDHLAITDSYQFAFQLGFTSKPTSKINRGIGMSTIFDVSKQIGLSLSVFDAESRGVLTNASEPTHNELRKVFYSVGFGVGFYYYGILKVKVK